LAHTATPASVLGLRPVRLSTPDLIMEGLRRIDAWSRMDAALGRVDARYARAADYEQVIPQMTLSLEKLEILTSLHQPRSVVEICDDSTLPDFEVCLGPLGLHGRGHGAAARCARSGARCVRRDGRRWARRGSPERMTKAVVKRQEAHDRGSARLVQRPHEALTLAVMASDEGGSSPRPSVCNASWMITTSAKRRSLTQVRSNLRPQTQTILPPSVVNARRSYRRH
jgi:hypothetical protein